MQTHSGEYMANTGYGFRDPRLEDPFYFGGDSMAGFTVKLIEI